MKFLLLALLICSCCRVDVTPTLAHVREETICRTGLDPFDCEIQSILCSPLTAQEATWVALVHNQKLQAQFEALGISYSDFVQASLPRNPTFSLDWRLPKDGNNIESDLLFPLSDLWQLPLRRRVACKALQVAKYDLIDALLQVREAASLQTHRLALARKHERLHTHLFEAQKRLCNLTEYRHANGVDDLLTLSMVRAGVGQRAIDLAEARQRVQMAEQELLYTLGMGDCYTEIAVSPVQKSAPPLPDAEKLVFLALQNNPALQADYYRVEQAKEAVRLERARTFRQIDLGVAYETEGSVGGFGPGLFVEIPLFDQNQAQISRAQHEWCQAARALRNHQLKIVKEIRELHTAYETAREAIELMGEQLFPALDTGSKWAEQYGKTGQVAQIVAVDQEIITLTNYIGYLDLVDQVHSSAIQIERRIGCSPPFLDEELMQKPLAPPASLLPPSNQEHQVQGTSSE